MSKLVDGLYDRLIYEDERDEISALANASRVQRGEPSVAQSREYLQGNRMNATVVNI